MRLGEEAVIMDGLTGLYRREETLRMAAIAFKEAIRKGEPMAVAMIDLDGLKRVNDAKGHDEGDLLLKRAANLIKGECRLRSDGRSPDICGRYGGDEFVVIMPNTSAKGAEAFLRRVREKADMRDMKFSYGIAENRSGTTNFASLVKTADRRMYKDKRVRKSESGDL
ncbi:MAG: GGDEF domain-containing protein [Candidatus Colwellbacteria bacterium]|nr:GGDEF domain-containing protein [Candidatus Colwellbacteria bacterium]